MINIDDLSFDISEIKLISLDQWRSVVFLNLQNLLISK